MGYSKFKRGLTALLVHVRELDDGPTIAEDTLKFIRSALEENKRSQRLNKVQKVLKNLRQAVPDQSAGEPESTKIAIELVRPFEDQQRVDFLNLLIQTLDNTIDEQDVKLVDEFVGDLQKATDRPEALGNMIQSLAELDFEEETENRENEEADQEN